ncbi:MAG: PilZ domain-containing protein [Candidatus Omnitrophota bacterium]
MNEERRKHVRFKSATIVQYKKGLLSVLNDTVTKDVSLGGLCFFSEKKIKIGKVVRLRIFYDGKSPAKVLKGRVVWSTECSDVISKGYLNGLTFLR